MGILRFLLAITVVIGHTSPILGFTFVGAQLAVQTFYIISGFYMALILNEKYVGANGSYKLFLTNRLLRLYPIYWTVLLCTIAYSLMLYIHTDGRDYGRLNMYIRYCHDIGPLSFLYLAFTNIFLFLQDTIMFLGLDTKSGHLFFTSNFRNSQPMLYQFMLIPQAWTIGVEIAFYLIAPFIARRKLSVIVPLILLSLLLRIALYFGAGLQHDPWTYRFFPTEMVFFFLGIAAYHLYKKIQTLEISAHYLKLIWLGIVSFTVCYHLFSSAYLAYLYLIVFFLSLPFVFMLTKKWKMDAFIGELSYPIYISHILVQYCLTFFKIPLIGGKGLTLTIFTILFSILLNELVAKRMEKVRQKRLS